MGPLNKKLTRFRFDDVDFGKQGAFSHLKFIGHLVISYGCFLPSYHSSTGCLKKVVRRLIKYYKIMIRWMDTWSSNTFPEILNHF